MTPSSTAALVAEIASLDAVLALLHLDLGRGADLDDGDAAGELGEALVQLLLVPVGVGVLDLLADLVDPGLDLAVLATAVDDRGGPPW
jgi:putative effector of murein hydrolase LrgA (UPF0299 family)